jgi:hypothetical protein
MHLLSMIVHAAAIAPSASDSTALSSLRQGDLLRMESKTRDGMCVYRRTTDDSLFVRCPGEDTIEGLAFSDLDRLEISLGPRSGSEGAQRGAIFGVLGGAAAGVVTGLIISQGADPEDFPEDVTAVVAGLGVGLVGGILGAVIGAIHPGEAWRRIDIEKSVGVGLDESGAPRVHIAGRIPL